MTGPANSRQAAHGRDADSPWHMPAGAWKQVLVRTWKESSIDNVGLAAAGVAFYGFLALVPLLGATVIIYGLVAEPQTVLGHARSLTAVLPADVAKLIGDQLMNVVQTSGGKKGLGLLLALAIALWGARNAATSVISALNIAYEEEEKRGFVKVTLLGLAMTVGAVLMALLGIGSTVVLGYLHHLVPDAGPVGELLWKVLTYALVGIAAAAAVAALYRYGPSREIAKWQWLSPGSLFASVAWLLLTLGFGFYVANFGNYNATYGSLGAVVVLLTWMYLSAYVLLFGAELTSELEHQTARDTTAGAPRPLGDRGAWAADHVASGADGETGGSHGSGQDAPAPHEDTGGASGDEVRAALPGRSSANAGRAEHAAPGRTRTDEGDHPYIASRLATRAGGLAGVQRIGMVSSALATIGLGLLRRRGREFAGVALIATAGALSLLRRD